MEGSYSTESSLTIAPYPEDRVDVIPRQVCNYSPILIGLVLGGLAVGTGGSLTGSSYIEFGRKARSTNTVCEVNRLSNYTSVPDDELLNSQERIAAIQHYFSLSIKDLAQILSVSRPTIYSWLRTEQEPQPANLIRIDKLYSITVLWQRICIRPIGRWVKAPIAEGRSLVQLFSEGEIDFHMIKTALGTIASLLERDEDDKRDIVKPLRSVGSQATGQDLLAQEFGI